MGLFDFGHMLIKELSSCLLMSLQPWVLSQKLGMKDSWIQADLFLDPASEIGPQSPLDLNFLLCLAALSLPRHWRFSLTRPKRL